MARLTTASYVKIIMIVLIGAILCSVFAFGSCGAWRFGLGGTQVIGDAQIDPASVDSIDIDWAAGSVTVKSVDTTESGTIEIAETSEGVLTKAQAMRWRMDGSTLSIDYGTSFACASFATKHLEVRIPKRYADTFKEIDIDGASGTYTVDGIGCTTFETTLASGSLHGSNIQADNLEVEVASGKADLSGVFKESLKAEAASGKVTINCEETCPRVIDADMASGTVVVSIPRGSGFTAKVDALSGNFESDFETTSKGDGTYVHGNGDADITVSLVSGKFTLARGA